MKVTYLEEHLCIPSSGDILEIADIPDGVRFFMRDKGTYRQGNCYYWKEGTVLWFMYVDRVEHNSPGPHKNLTWLQERIVVNYRGEII